MSYKAVERVISRPQNRTPRLKTQVLGTASAFALAMAGCLASPQLAHAQAESNGETVTVTGSRIATPGFEAPTPVSSVGAAQIAAAGVLNVNQLEFQIPQFVPQIQYQGNGGNVGAVSINLRGLGSTRTLILMNSLRVMPTSFDGTTDANIIPTSLVKRIDVVTGGASAAYGSDAISGVVNFVLDDSFEGLKGNAYAGQSQYHDVNEVDFSLTGGTSFAGGRGHFEMSGELYSNSGANQGASKRPLLNMGWAGVANPAFVVTNPTGNGVGGAAGNNGPQIVVAPNVGFSNMAPGGMIASGPLKGIYFGPAGIPENMVFGQYVSGNLMFGGNGFNFTSLYPLYPVLGRQTLFTRATYDLAPDTTVWGQVNIIHTTGETITNPNYFPGTAAAQPITIGIDNPFLPASIVTQMNTNHLTNFILGREMLEMGATVPTNQINDIIYSTGITGKVFDTWSWDADIQYNKLGWVAHEYSALNMAKWLDSYTVVANPAVGGVAGVAVGSPVCKSTLANPTNGCIANNILGPDLQSPRGIAYYTGIITNTNPQESWDVAINLRGVALKDWAGDISVAAGGEVRRDSIHGTTDAISAVNGWRSANVQPVIGNFQVEEGYLEVNVPLLQNEPFARSMDLDLAGRLTNYSNFGTVETWKVGLNYSVNDDLRFRGTMSSDIRAPTLSELYNAIGVNTTQLRNDVTNASNAVVQGTGGNPNLLPEQANTYTAGIVYSPEWLPGFQVSLDWYNIRLHNQISTSTGQAQVDNCQLYHIATACALITFKPNGDLAVVNSIPYNVGQVLQDGVDFESSYSFGSQDLFDFLPDGSMNISAKANYVDSYTTIGGSGAILQNVGVGSNAKWRAVVNAGYQWSKYAIHVTWRYAGATRYSNAYITGLNINQNDIGSRYYFNLSAEYEIAPGIKLFAKSDNIFNVSPPISASLSGVIEPSAATSQIYDNIGRTYGAGIRFNL